VERWNPSDKTNPEELGNKFEGDIAISSGEKNGIIDEEYRYRFNK
jgi:hypothetical protein